MRRFFALTIFLLPAFSGLSAETVTARQLAALRKAPDSVGRHYRVSGEVQTVFKTIARRVILEDETGTVSISYYKDNTDPDIKAGDHITASVTVKQQHDGRWLKFDSFEVIGHQELSPKTVSVEEFKSGLWDNRLIKLEGTLREVSLDELDSRWVVLLFYAKEQVFHVYMTPAEEMNRAREMIGSRLTVTGICVFSFGGQRKYAGRSIWIPSAENLSRQESPPSDPFHRPDIRTLANSPAATVFEAGRHRTQGRVIATWGDRYLLVRSADGTIVKIDSTADVLPQFNDVIEAEGLPEPDLSHVNLIHANWRQAGTRCDHLDQTYSLSGNQLFADDNGRPRIDTTHHGRAVQMSGTATSTTARERSAGIINILSDGFLIPVDCSSNPSFLADIEDGAFISAGGTCVADFEKWQPGALVPHATGIRIIPRTASDIVVLARPSRWTPIRLFWIICALSAVLIGISTWNFSLRRIAERRGREIATISLARAEADIKTFERTRLAVELHDSIAQNLTGATMELRTADILADSDPAGMHKYLTLAAKTLDSCREDLRNCIWDLRNLTLDETSVDEAIRKTLEPHVTGVSLQIRFNIPREQLTDNTAHTILRIIRELVLNAIRHGKATHIRIAGSVENGKLLFSVKDDGCGFDPEKAPGMGEGHFGLQGIRDRIKTFGGDVEISSRPGSGTKVIVSINIPGQSEKTNGT